MSEERIEEPQSTLQWVLGLAAQGQVLTPLPKDWRVAYTALASLRSRLSQAEEERDELRSLLKEAHRGDWAQLPGSVWDRIHAALSTTPESGR